MTLQNGKKTAKIGIFAVSVFLKSTAFKLRAVNQ